MSDKKEIDNEMIDNFEEKYGTTEDFSKRSVSSLFDDDMPRRPEDASRRPAFLEPDPEAEYARYMEMARENMRHEAKRKEKKQQAAIDQREEALEEFSQAIGKRPRRPKPITESDVYVYKERPPAGPRLNMRNIADIGLFAVLSIFAVLVWQLTASAGRVSYANAQIAEMNYELLELRGYRVQIESLNTQIAELQMDNDRLNDALAAGQAAGGNVHSNEAEDGTQEAYDGPASAAAPGRTHTVLPGQGHWAVAEAALGNGLDWDIIRHYNDLPADVVLQPGQVLRIPN